MKWKTKEITKNVEWTEVFIWRWPVKTREGYTVVFEKVFKRWKPDREKGEWVYSMNGPNATRTTE